MTRRSAVDLGEQGMLKAIERLAAALGVRGGPDPRLPFNEALFWAYALRESHKARLTENTYYRLSKQSDEGRTTEGAMYARNHITHGLANVMHVDVIPGSEPGMMMLGRSQPGASTRYQYRWAPLPEDASPDKAGRDDVYRDEIAGQELMPVLETMAKFLIDLGSAERV
jgi:hypothetical protein